MTRLLAVMALPLVLAGRLPAQIPADRLQAAINEGMRYPNRLKYLEKGTADNKCKWAGAFSIDGISKDIRFFTDFDIVATAAAAANAEMKKFSADDAQTLPLQDLLFANVSMTARGQFPVQRLRDKYAQSGVHVVLQIGDSIVQPLSKNPVQTSGSTTPIATLWQWYDLGGVSLLTGTPLGYSSQRFQQEFVFPLGAASLPNDLVVWVIDADGKRSKVGCDLTRVRKL